MKINADGVEIEELKEIYRNTVLDWKEYMSNVKNKREEKIIELYPYNIANDTEENIK